MAAVARESRIDHNDAMHQSRRARGSSRIVGSRRGFGREKHKGALKIAPVDLSFGAGTPQIRSPHRAVHFNLEPLVGSISTLGLRNNGSGSEAGVTPGRWRVEGRGIYDSF
jgi:hypothetical protein